MLIDADDIEESRHQSMHIPELNATTGGLARSDPVQNTARGRKVNPQQPVAVNHNAPLHMGLPFEDRQRLAGITRYLTTQDQLVHGRRVH